MPIQFKGLLFVFFILLGVKISTCQRSTDVDITPAPVYTFNDSLIAAVNEEACSNELPKIAEIPEPTIIPEPEPVQPRLSRKHYRKSRSLVADTSLTWSTINPYHPRDTIKIETKSLSDGNWYHGAPIRLGQEPAIPSDTIREIVIEGYPRKHVERITGIDTYNEKPKPDLKWEYSVFDSFRISYCVDYGALNVHCNGEYLFAIPPLTTPSAETSRYKTGDTTELVELTNADAIIHIIRYQEGYSESGNVWIRIFDKNALDAGNVTPSWQGGDILVFKTFIGPED